MPLLARLFACQLACAGPIARAATCTVTSTADTDTSSPNTLRYCLNNYSSGDTIDITATGTITLTSVLPAVSNNRLRQ